MENPVIQAQNRKGKILIVCSAKGGVGKTTLAVNLAIALTKKKLQVALMDGDFQFGDVNVAMDLGASFSISDVAESIETLNPTRLNGFLSKHESDVRVLPAPESPELADLITADMLDDICNLLLHEFDYLIVDTGVGLNDQTLLLMEKADQILLMTTLELISLKNTKRLIQIFDTLELRDKVKVVLNRSTMESVIEAEQVPAILAIDTFYSIPNNFNAASNALNLGIPLVINKPSGDIAKAIFKIAEQLDSNATVVTPKKQPLFSRLWPGPTKKRRI